jgi:hypothetical protein
MNYLLVFSLLFIFLSYSNFLNLKYKIKLNETYFISLCLIILITYLLFQLQFNYNIGSSKKILVILLFSSAIFFIYLIKNYKKIKFSLNIEFVFFIIIIFLLSKDRYYLDQDEFTYWGLAIKALTLDLSDYNFFHHPQGLNFFRNLFVIFGFNEGMTIFSNNIILISGFFFLFYKRELTLIQKVIFFFIYYLLLNNLSFGFVSIYSDPILAIFYACIINKIFFIFTDKKSENDFSIILIFISILLINRSSPIYFLYALYFVVGLFFIENYKKKNNNFFIKFILIIFSLLYFIYKFYLPLFLTGHHELKTIFEYLVDINTYLKQLINLLIQPIYFSSFGTTINSTFDLIFSINYKINEFQIPLLVYIVLLLPFFIFKFKHKNFLLISSIFLILIYTIIVLVLKLKIENLHISATPRYVGIMILAKYFFIISIVVFNKQHFNKNFIFVFFLFFLIVVTPKKTLGFFVTDNIYYSSVSNKNFKINRDKISTINTVKNSYDNFLIIHKKNYSDYTNNNISGEDSFYHNIIEYELFPKKPKYIELNDYLLLSESLNEKNMLLIYFDLPSSDILKIKTNVNFFKINTY